MKSYLKRLTSVLAIVMILPLFFSLSVNETFAEQQFTDLKLGDFGHDQIIDLYERGVVNGYPGNEFRPNIKLNRAQAAVMFQRALELPTPTNVTSFKDVKEDMYYAKEVAATKQANIFKGKSDGTFGPEDQLTREQMATLLVRVLNLQPIPSIKVAFNDIDKVHPVHRDDVITLYQHEITKGKSGNVYDPKGHVTRAEFSVFVVRSLGDNLPPKSNEEELPVQPPTQGENSQPIYPEVTSSYILTDSNNRIDAAISGTTVTYTLPLSQLTELSSVKINVTKDVVMTVRVKISDVDINEERSQSLTQGENNLSIGSTIKNNASLIELLGSFSAEGTIADGDGNSSPIRLVFNIIQ